MDWKIFSWILVAAVGVWGLRKLLDGTAPGAPRPRGPERDPGFKKAA